MTPAEIINKVLEKHGVTREEVFRPGCLPHIHRAARYDVVWSLYRIGMRPYRIAEIMGINRSAVSKIVRKRRKWDYTIHMPDPVAIDDGLRCLPDLREKIIPILRKHKTNWRTIISHQRHHRLNAPRYEIYEILRSRGWSTPRIGKFCNRDYSTIVYRLMRNGPMASIQLRDAA